MKVSFSRHLENQTWVDIETDDGSKYHLPLLLASAVVKELGLLDKVFIEEEK